MIHKRELIIAYSYLFLIFQIISLLTRRLRFPRSVDFPLKINSFQEKSCFTFYHHSFSLDGSIAFTFG